MLQMLRPAKTKELTIDHDTETITERVALLHTVLGQINLKFPRKLKMSTHLKKIQTFQGIQK